MIEIPWHTAYKHELYTKYMQMRVGIQKWHCLTLPFLNLNKSDLNFSVKTFHSGKSSWHRG